MTIERIYVAGITECAGFAEAEHLAELIKRRFGTEILIRSVPSEEWSSYAARLKADMGFITWTQTSPVVWSGLSGRYIGGCDQLRELAAKLYGWNPGQDLAGIDFAAVAAENKKQQDAAQREASIPYGTPFGKMVVALCGCPGSSKQEFLRRLKTDFPDVFVTPKAVVMTHAEHHEHSQAENTVSAPGALAESEKKNQPESAGVSVGEGAAEGAGGGAETGKVEAQVMEAQGEKADTAEQGKGGEAEGEGEGEGIGGSGEGAGEKGPGGEGEEGEGEGGGEGEGEGAEDAAARAAAEEAEREARRVAEEEELWELPKGRFLEAVRKGRLFEVPSERGGGAVNHPKGVKAHTLREMAAGGHVSLLNLGPEACRKLRSSGIPSVIVAVLPPSLQAARDSASGSVPPGLLALLKTGEGGEFAGVFDDVVVNSAGLDSTYERILGCIHKSWAAEVAKSKGPPPISIWDSAKGEYVPGPSAGS